MKNHLTAEEIERYIDSEYLLKDSNTYTCIQENDNRSSVMSVEEIIKIEEHLVNCDSCLERVTKALEFTLSYQQWLGDQPSPKEKMMIKILKALNHEKTDVKSRIIHWIKDWQAFMNNTVDVFMETTYKGIANITKLLKGSFKEKENGISFRYPVESFAMRGNPQLKYEKKAENKLLGFMNEKKVIEIKAHSENKSLFIKCDTKNDETASPIIILIPEQVGEPVIKMAKKIQGNEQFEISIEGLTPGKYLLAIEPESLYKKA